MGNAQRIQDNQVIRSRGQFTFLAVGKDCTIVSNEQSKLTAEQYKLPLQNSWQLNNIKIYQFRRVQNSHLVRVYNVEADTSNQVLLVRTELIPTRLADIENLTPQEALYVALYSLIGFRYIYQMCQRRLFSINDSMIGFTPEGNVKVWINRNFAVNELDVEAFKSRPVRTQSELVNLVLDSVARRTIGHRLPQRFLAHYNSKQDRSITDTLRCFKHFLQSENVAIANRVDIAGKVRSTSNENYGYVQNAEGSSIPQTFNVNTTQNAIITNEGPKIPQPLGKQLYTRNVSSQTYQIPSVSQQTSQRTQERHYYTSEETKSNLSHKPPLFQHQQGLPRRQLSETVGTGRILTNHQLPIDPRTARTSTLEFLPRSHTQSQMYTRQGTSNFPIPSNAVNNIHLNRPPRHPHYQTHQQAPYRRTPVVQAQLAPALGSTTKVINVERYQPIVVQEGKVQQRELRTQKEIREAMSPEFSLHKTYIDPQSNKAINYIGLSNLEQIKKHRAPVSNDYVSGENRNLSFVNPDVLKMMMFPKSEQVYYNSPLNNVHTHVEQPSISTPNPYYNSLSQPSISQINNQYQSIKRSIASDNRSNYSSLSKRSNRSYKADKLVLMGGKAFRSNPVEVTEINSQVGSVPRTETTVYHEMSSFGLHPVIKEEEPYSYGSSSQAPLSIPTSPYRNLHTQIIEQRVWNI